MSLVGCQALWASGMMILRFYTFWKNRGIMLPRRLHSLAHSLTETLLLWCPVPEHIKQASLLSCWKLGHWGPLNVPKYFCYLLSTVYFVENSSSVLCARCQFSLPCKKIRELGKLKNKQTKKKTLCKTRKKNWKESFAIVNCSVDSNVYPATAPFPAWSGRKGSGIKVKSSVPTLPLLAVWPQEIWMTSPGLSFLAVKLTHDLWGSLQLQAFKEQAGEHSRSETGSGTREKRQQNGGPLDRRPA